MLNPELFSERTLKKELFKIVGFDEESMHQELSSTNDQHPLVAEIGQRIANLIRFVRFGFPFFAYIWSILFRVLAQNGCLSIWPQCISVIWAFHLK